jgi:hypothetical protein
MAIWEFVGSGKGPLVAGEDPHRPEPEDSGCVDDSEAVSEADSASSDDSEPEYEEIDLQKGGAA